MSPSRWVRKSRRDGAIHLPEPVAPSYHADVDPAQAAADWEKLRTWEMPFGKFSGRKLYDLPAEYLCWFEQKGWPSGDLGRLLQIVLEAKRQGADHAFAPLRK
jgi:uncharacterized protein (DUF3820 family)